MRIIKQRKSLRILAIASFIAIACLLIISYLPVHAAPSVRYWVLDSGNTSATTNWSYTSGGAGGDPVPDAETTIYFDAASFTGGGKVVTVDAPLVCASMVWTDGADAPDLAMTSTITSGGNVTLITGMTLSGTSAIIMTAGNFDGAGLTIPELQLNGSAHTVSGANTFTTLSRTGTATQTDTLTLTAGTTQTITGTFTVNGNSATNRLLVNSSSAGNAATITVPAINITASNVDFQDITFTNATDLSGIAGGTIGFSGTTNLTCTYPYDVNDTLYWYGGSGTWNTDIANQYHWSTATGGTGSIRHQAPTTTNNVYFDANSFIPALQQVLIPDSTKVYCHDMEWTGATGIPDLEFGSTLGSPTINISGSVVFINAMTMTNAPSLYRGELEFAPSNTDETLTTNGLSITARFFVQGSGTGKLTLLDELNVNSTGIELITGELDTNGQTVNTTGFSITGTGVRTATLGSSDINCTGTSSGWYATDVTNLIFDAGTSIISVSGAVFSGGGASITYSTVNLVGITTCTVYGSNTYSALNIDRTAGAKTVHFTAGTTQTVSSFSITGTGTALITMDSTSLNTAWNIVDTAGANVVDYVSLTDSHASGGATFFAGLHSVSVSGNTGWIFDLIVPNNANSVILARNDVASYSDYFKITINGTEELWYQPSAIISGTTLLDKDSTQDGTITWGTNATDVTATWGSLAYVGTGSSTTPLSSMEGNQQGIAPTIGGSPYNTPTPTVAPNFLSGVFTVFNQVSMITPDGLNNGTYAVPVYFFWLTLFTLLIFGGMVLSLKYLPNQLIGAIAEIGLSILAYRMGVYPFAAILIIVVCSITIIVWERKQQI